MKPCVVLVEEEEVEEEHFCGIIFQLSSFFRLFSCHLPRSFSCRRQMHFSYPTFLSFFFLSFFLSFLLSFSVSAGSHGQEVRVRFRVDDEDRLTRSHWLDLLKSWKAGVQMWLWVRVGVRTRVGWARDAAELEERRLHDSHDANSSKFSSSL